jgi:hypothetical protein
MSHVRLSFVKEDHALGARMRIQEIQDNNMGSWRKFGVKMR